jgi:outer membrane immunogenic protein
MKKILIAGIAAATFCGASAIAADMPTKGPVYKAAPALYDWSGFYAGVSGGWVDGGRNEVIFLPPAAGSATSKGLNGGILGGVYGYNWQFNNLVIGTRSDLSWANADSTISTGGAGCGGATFACNDRLRWLSTTRGRLGFTAGPTGNWLIYGTGGYAWGSIRRFDTETGGGTSITESKTNSGWTWGGGIEVGLTPQWALGFEALRVDLTHSKIFPASGAFANEHVKDTFDIYRLSLTYRFGDLWGKSPVSAKY